MKTQALAFLSLLCFAGVPALASSITFTPISQWNYNEPAGTTFLNTVDSIGGRIFNGNINGATTNGSGQLRYASSATWPDRTTAITTNPEGIYQITVEFASWNVSTFPLTQGPRLFFGFYEGTDLEVGVVGEMELQFFGDGIDLYFGDSDGEFLFGDFAPVVLTSPLTVQLTINMVEGTYELSYAYTTEFGPEEDSASGSLSFVSAARNVGTFGITSNRNFNPAGSTPPLIERITVSHGTIVEETGPSFAAFLSENDLEGEDAAFDADPDKDGVVNLLEYALGLNPTDGASAASMPVVGRDGDFLTLTFARQARPDLRYEVQVAGDLEGWVTIWSSEGTANTEGTVVIYDDVPLSSLASPTRQMRLGVSLLD
ncbi:MAG: hypothetical protein JJT96_12270 [Opitutales bacterium]|nr:hypothetical protein [Opitutales bacterium]